MKRIHTLTLILFLVGCAVFVPTAMASADPLVCPEGTVPGWTGEDGLPTSCVNNLPNPGAVDKGETPVPVPVVTDVPSLPPVVKPVPTEVAVPAPVPVTAPEEQAVPTEDAPEEQAEDPASTETEKPTEAAVVPTPTSAPALPVEHPTVMIPDAQNAVSNGTSEKTISPDLADTGLPAVASIGIGIVVLLLGAAVVALRLVNRKRPHSGS